MDAGIIYDIDKLAITESKSCEVEDCEQYLSLYQYSLTILTQNIRSIYKNVDSFNVFLQRFNYDCDIMVLTECWLTNRLENIPTIPGYSSHSSKINRNQNDGVIIYCKETLHVEIEEPNIYDCNCLIIKIETNTAIIDLYRSHSVKNLDSFHMFLDKTLKGLSSFNNIIITGDINININPGNCEFSTHEYLNLCSFHGLLPGHTLPTHQSGSCLDHMILKTKLPGITLVTNSTITDHHTVILTLNLLLPQLKCSRIKTNLNISKLERDLCNIDFTSIYKSADANTSLDYLIKHLQSAILRNTTESLVSKKFYNLKPWITPGLIRCIRHRDKLHQKAKKYPDNYVLQISYKRYRNFCNNLIKKIKINYDKDELHKAGKNTKQLWKHIKNCTFLSKKHESNSGLLLTTSSPLATANFANNYFAYIGKTLAEKIPKITRYQHTASTRNSNSFVLLNTDELEISRIISGLKDDSATGWDNINNKILKRFKYLVLP
jgi:hypothetical protein